MLEEELRQRRIQQLGPRSKALSHLQRELLTGEEPPRDWGRSGSESAAREYYKDRSEGRIGNDRPYRDSHLLLAELSQPTV